MKLSAKTGLIFLIISILISSALAYENELFPGVNFFEDQYIKGYRQPNIYDMSSNPAFFRTAYSENLTVYQLSAQRQLNLYSRYFDPQSKDDIGLDLEWIKQLSRNSTLAAGVKYYRSFHNEVNRSLEKNYYDHYFALTDTTMGDIEYQGPQLSVLYNHELADQFLLGLEINYGVERGLKDIYTECETILRNIDLKAGIGYKSADEQTYTGISARYFNRQGKYEAVKEYEDAFVKTWFGYHLYFPENPRSTNRKDDDREGYRLGVQFERKNILNTGLGIRLSGDFGAQKNTTKVGRPTFTQPRGYWEREGYDLTGNIYYHKNGIHGQLFFNQCDYYDWASPKTYDVLVLENDQQVNRIGSLINVEVFQPLELDAGFEIRSINTDYTEYVADFQYNETRNENFLLLGAAYNLNTISSVNIRGSYSSLEPDFHWEGIDKINVMSLQAGYGRQFVFGKLDLNFIYQLSDLDNAEDNIEQFGISIMYRK